MGRARQPLTLGGRVNEQQMARVDAAARLAGKPRAHFIVEAALQRANDILREAVGGDSPAEQR